MSSTSTMHSRMAGSVASIDSLRSGDPFSRSPRVSRSQLEEIPEGPSTSHFYMTSSVCDELIRYRRRLMWFNNTRNQKIKRRSD